VSDDVIILKVQNYLSELQKGNGKRVEFPVINDFNKRLTSTLLRQLSPEGEREFTLRCSSLGRPGCILQSEQMKRPQSVRAYSDRFRNIFGDMVEAAAMTIMRQAGVNVVSEQGKVVLDIDGASISGTYDVIIAEPEPKLYDIKSASSWTYKHKYKDKTLQNLWDEGDGFGYVTQNYLYSQALGIPVGGLIVINKEDGSWTIVPPPIDDSELRLKALKKAHDNKVRITTNQPFKRDFEDVEETFRKKKTGNRILPFACAMCQYREACWPEAVELPQLSSKGQSPKQVWYTHVSEENK
jgi:hypothetical protein